MSLGPLWSALPLVEAPGAQTVAHPAQHCPPGDPRRPQTDGGGGMACNIKLYRKAAKGSSEKGKAKAQEVVTITELKTTQTTQRA